MWSGLQIGPFKAAYGSPEGAVAGSGLDRVTWNPKRPKGLSKGVKQTVKLA